MRSLTCPNLDLHLAHGGLPLLLVLYLCISKSYCFEKSVKGVLMLLGDSNFTFTWSKAIKTIFYELTYLTLPKPPFGSWGFAPTLGLIFMYWQKLLS